MNRLMRPGAGPNPHCQPNRTFQYEGGAVARLAWQLPARNQAVTWSSEAADSIDYYFIYGPDLDQVINGYRELTGAAPMMGKWGWSFWQCKERCKSQPELSGSWGGARF